MSASAGGQWREDLSLSPKLGCFVCPDFRRCQGLRIPAAAMDCTTFCDCEAPELCDRACRRNPYFVQRVMEVDGFDFLKLPAPSTTKTPFLNGHAPLIYHGSNRELGCESAIAAISLFSLFDRRTGVPRFSNRSDLIGHFRISPDALLVASGTDDDAPLERWWDLNKAKKHQVYENLRALEIGLVTSPNYSVFNNVPYWDNEHNQKRGILTWAEFMSAGVPAALHLNCHRESDYARYTELLTARPDIKVVAVEFGTGMGHPSRAHLHASYLCRLARDVRRPLGIVVRGGLPLLQSIASAFSSVLLIDTEPFVRTMRRRRATLTNDFRVGWFQELTSSGVMLDVRLQEAIDACATSFHHMLLGDIGGGPARFELGPTANRNQESRNSSDDRQLSLFFPPVYQEHRVAGPEAHSRVETVKTNVELAKSVSVANA